MIWTLIRKDLSLLRLYLRSLVGALIACFVAAAILIFWDVRDAGQSFADSRFMIASILAGGSLPGLIVVTIFSALLSGSIITLERSDRSSQFLACLPPRRLQNYLSKLVVGVEIQCRSSYFRFTDSHLPVRGDCGPRRAVEAHVF